MISCMGEIITNIISITIHDYVIGFHIGAKNYINIIIILYYYYYSTFLSSIIVLVILDSAAVLFWYNDWLIVKLTQVN